MVAIEGRVRRRHGRVMSVPDSRRNPAYNGEWSTGMMDIAEYRPRNCPIRRVGGDGGRDSVVSSSWIGQGGGHGRYRRQRARDGPRRRCRRSDWRILRYR